jgi:predicted RNase H-like HicB family nuclease
MERIINLHIEKLPEGVYLATSDDVQGLVAQGRTVSEAIEIARDVARRLFEAKMEREGGQISLPAVSDKFDYALVIGT